MGKGDKKSKRGKIHIGSFGVKRPRKKAVSKVATAKKAKKAAPKKAAKKAK
jgi:30S ribosomal protein S31